MPFTKLSTFFKRTEYKKEKNQSTDPVFSIKNSMTKTRGGTFKTLKIMMTVKTSITKLEDRA